MGMTMSFDYYNRQSEEIARNEVPPISSLEALNLIDVAELGRSNMQITSMEGLDGIDIKELNYSEYPDDSDDPKDPGYD